MFQCIQATTERLVGSDTVDLVCFGVLRVMECIMNHLRETVVSLNKVDAVNNRLQQLGVQFGYHQDPVSKTWYKASISGPCADALVFTAGDWLQEIGPTLSPMVSEMFETLRAINLILKEPSPSVSSGRMLQELMAHLFIVYRLCFNADEGFAHYLHVGASHGDWGLQTVAVYLCD